MFDMKTMIKFSGSVVIGLLVTQISLADRQWEYSYNSDKKMITANGPRLDVLDITRYDYDVDKNLSQITNALGHARQFSNYSVDSLPATYIDQNGTETSYTHNWRGQILSKTTHSAQGDAAEQYVYENVRIPGGSVLSAN